MVKVSVISVTYNNEDTIEPLISSIEKNMEEVEILIVDNQSMDGTAGVIEKYSKVKLIKNSSNIGYAKANNVAAREALGEYLFFLNPDAKLAKKFPKKIFEMFEEDDSIGIIAPKIMTPSGEQKSVRRLPTIMGAIREYYFNEKNLYEEFIPSGEDSIEVESVVGAAFIISRKLFLELGGFDERFFLYFEDLDLCRRVRERGKRIIYLPNFIVSHLVGYSKAGSKEKWLKQSARKYHGFIKYLLLTFILRLRPKKLI